MKDLNPPFDDVRATLERENNRINRLSRYDPAYYVPPVDLDHATRLCLGALERVRTEPNDRYKSKRLRKIIYDLEKGLFSDFGSPPKTEPELLESRNNHLVCAYLSGFTELLELSNHDAPYIANDLTELERFYPKVYNDVDLKQWSYDDWKAGRFVPHEKGLKRIWGVLSAGNSEPYRARIGKTFSAVFLPKAEAEKIEAHQSELGEKYVIATLNKYRSWFEGLTPDKKAEAVANYAKGLVDLEFTGFRTYSYGGRDFSNIGAKYTGSPHNKPNGLLDWWQVMNARGQKYYQYVTAQMLDNLQTNFIQGDAEAFYRFAKQLVNEGEAINVAPAPVPIADNKLADWKTQVLKLFLAQPDGSGGSNELYRLVAEAVPKVKGGVRKARSIKSLYSKWKNGKTWITNELIEHITNELEAEGKPINWTYIELIKPNG